VCPGEDLSTAASASCIFPTPADAVWGPQLLRKCGQSWQMYDSLSSRRINNAKGILDLIIALSLATNLEPLLLLDNSGETALSDESTTFLEGRTDSPLRIDMDR
jgi:hypothetical protein